MLTIFEQPWTLLVGAILVLLATLIYRSVCPEKIRMWQWLLPILLIVAAFGLDALVETDSEKIKTVLAAAVKAVENENPDAVEITIADNYIDSHHRSKDALMLHCRRTLSEPLIEKNIMRIVSADIQPPEADVIFTVRVLFDKQSPIYQGFKQQMLTELQADLQKQLDGRWLINRIELLKIDFHPASWQDVKESNW